MLAPARPSGDVMTRARRGMRLLQWAMPTPMPRADLEVLLARYARMIDAVARRVCGRHHHCLLPDVEQEVRLALWRRLQDGDAIRHPAAYVYKVALATSLAVVRRYRPGRFDGPVTIFWPADEPRRVRVASSRAWRRAAPRARMRRVPGAHLSPITTHVGDLARQMRACLDGED